MKRCYDNFDESESNIFLNLNDESCKGGNVSYDDGQDKSMSENGTDKSRNENVAHEIKKVSLPSESVLTQKKKRVQRYRNPATH